MREEASVELIRRAQTGDADALGHLVNRYLPRLRRWAAGRLPVTARDLGDTNDVVQEAVIRTFRNLDRFEDRGEGALQAYLRQAVMNRIRDEIRRTGRRPRVEVLSSGAVDPSASPLDHAVGSEAVERYERALAQLSDADREVIIARLEFGHDYAAIAALVGKPSAGAARVALSRALRKLAALMAQS
jgi:RNA polymerase sigma factor (sigma-70 family)